MSQQRLTRSRIEYKRRMRRTILLVLLALALGIAAAAFTATTSSSRSLGLQQFGRMVDHSQRGWNNFTLVWPE